MLKLEIKLNKQKIETVQEVTLGELQRKLDWMFAEWDLPKEELADGTMFYVGKGRPRDYGAFGLLIMTLHEKEWFMNYVERWVWYNSDDGRTEEDYSIEDVLYFFTKKRSEGRCHQMN